MAIIKTLKKLVSGTQTTMYPRTVFDAVIRKKSDGTTETLTDVLDNLPSGGAVDSVNGQTGAVVLDAEDVGALPDSTVIPTKTSQLTEDSGFAYKADISTKLEEPSTFSVGQFFKVSAIDSDGHAVLEAVDASTVGVQDVQVNGTSILSDGVANVTVATSTAPGVVVPGNGLSVTSNGGLRTVGASTSLIDARTDNFRVITSNNLDYAVKAALTDGVGADYTAAEQVAACERIGTNYKGVWETVYDNTLTEDTNKIVINLAHKIDGIRVYAYIPSTTNAEQFFIKYEASNAKIICCPFVSTASNSRRWSAASYFDGFKWFSIATCSNASEWNDKMYVLNQSSAVIPANAYAANDELWFQLSGINGYSIPSGSRIILSIRYCEQ